MEEVVKDASASLRLHKRLKELDCIGFDMDHTLVRYKIQPLIELVYDSFASYLVEKEGYNPALLKYNSKSEIYQTFLHRGIIVDKKFGNVLKVDPNKFVIQATHGFNLLNKEDLDRYYPEPLYEFTGGNSNRFFPIITYFEMAIAPLWSHMIALDDEIRRKNISKEEEEFLVYGDHFQAIVRSLRASFASWKDGPFFEKMREEVGKYVYKASPQLISWLSEVRKNDCHLFIATNSGPEFTQLLMSYCFGEDFHDIFDIVVVNCSKPAFFTESKDLQSLHSYFPDVTPQQLVKDLYQEGCASKLESLLQTKITKSGPLKVCYLGDHLLGDVVAPKKTMNWLTVAILEELEDPDEIVYFESSTDKSSLYWGSFFFLHTHQHQHHIHHHEDSFYSRLIRQHADICVPSVDAFVEFYNEPAEKDKEKLSPSVIYHVNKTLQI